MPWYIGSQLCACKTHKMTGCHPHLTSTFIMAWRNPESRHKKGAPWPHRQRGTPIHPIVMQTEYATLAYLTSNWRLLSLKLAFPLTNRSCRYYYDICKNLCYFKFYEAESFPLVSAPKIAHLSANVNPVPHKNQIYWRTGSFILFANIRTGLRNLARKLEKSLKV